MNYTSPGTMIQVDNKIFVMNTTQGHSNTCVEITSDLKFIEHENKSLPSLSLDNNLGSVNYAVTKHVLQVNVPILLQKRTITKLPAQ